MNGCTTPWAAFNPTNYPISYPGSLTARCTLKYNDASGRHTIETKLSATITVPPPDGVEIVSGDNVPQTFGKFNSTVFRITCKKEPCFYFSGVLAQERLTNVTNPITGKVLLLDGGWLPIPGKPAAAIF